jgi:hypothetical protein
MTASLLETVMDAALPTGDKANLGCGFLPSQE